MEKRRNILETTPITFIIELNDSKRATTISFKSLLCEINLNGLNTLKILKILIKGMLIVVNDISRSELTTIPKSSTFHES
jgi:hypothetical protein